jgi:hypothetical protein
MTKEDIINLIREDEWMMQVLHLAEELNFPNWFVGAGFVRNKVWDYLHGYHNVEVDTKDIDLVYFDIKGNDYRADESLSKKLIEETGIRWEIINEVYAHKFNNRLPFTSTEDAISSWPETATCIGVNLDRGKLTLLTPYGISDIVNLCIKVNPKFPDNVELVKSRVKEKNWLVKWPKLTLEL